MISEILRELSALENIDDTTSGWVLLWAQRVEVQREQKALDKTKETKDFDSIGQNIQRCDSVMHKKQKQVESTKRQCPTCHKMCGRCGKTNHFRAIC